MTESVVSSNEQPYVAWWCCGAMRLHMEEVMVDGCVFGGRCLFPVSYQQHCFPFNDCFVTLSSFSTKS